ncbi:hypothetical protein HYALB_00006445 [Hymenoscyphus albidus]|uniref:Hsp70 protein n=1 Tax=Hymenoscyphus albidus TaxID=595503 RepID=A0A9N9LJD6_9HELO|nr:hypothetical protein HYALB_00006445 [Hymenoscyphus albidus]
MLLGSQHTEFKRAQLYSRTAALIDRQIIQRHRGEDFQSVSVEDVEDIIADFLTPVLSHTKERLGEKRVLSETYKTSFVLTVPAMWCEEFSRRVMENALATAVRKSGLTKLPFSQVPDIFFTLEPDAAANFIVASWPENFRSSETIVILDCGGGTVDVGAYDLSVERLLRTKQAVCDPIGKSFPPIAPTKQINVGVGDNCGSNFLNVNFESLIRQKLASEDYLHDIESSVGKLVYDFEIRHKRSQEFRDKRKKFYVQGLRPCSERSFLQNYVVLSNEEMRKEIFEPIVRRVEALLQTILQRCLHANKRIKQVFLVGGFGASPYLRVRLSEFLREFANDSNLVYQVSLVHTSPDDSASAISSGALIRDYRMERKKVLGPKRRAAMSLGILRLEDPNKRHPGHRGYIPKYDESGSGTKHVQTIDWFVCEGTTLEEDCELTRFQCGHEFEAINKELRCEEVIFWKKGSAKSHFHIDAQHNRGAKRILEICTSLGSTPKGMVQRTDYQTFTNDLVVSMKGRKLRFESWFEGALLKSQDISIASVFEPGTL